MAITVTTDMKYTRSGEDTESVILSAHNPLIWEFEDAAIAASPTATIQFIVKDNTDATIYTSAIFPAYLLSYVDPLAKFCFDATQIIKHIINNYFYKEMSKIIDPENYGSGVEITIKTYDDAVLEDTEVLTYFASHAINQIGDEYGTNIPRLFYNDTEDIAHFLGYPTKAFFYLASDWANSSQFVHSTNDKGSPTYVLGYSRFSPLYYYNNKTYCVWMQRSATGYDSTGMIWAYNHLTDIASDNYDLHTPSESVTGGDDHDMVSVIVADDKHIVVVQEVQRAGTHNGELSIKRSDAEEDETNWSQARLENANYYITIGNTSTERLAYPILHKDHSGNLYIICRHYVSGGRYNRIYKSTDHGVSWDAGHTIIDSESDTIWLAPCAMFNGTDNTLRYVINGQDNAAAYHDKVFYLESDDGGVTWHDISHSFSKDTVVSGAITLTELEANDFLVVTKTDVGKDNVVPKSGTIDDAGVPYIAIVDYDTGGPYDYSMYYWTGAAWTFAIIKEGAENTTHILIHKEGTIFNCYLEETANQMTLYETVNLTSWAKVRDVKSTAGLTANTFLINSFTNNYKDADYWIFAGVYGTDAAYSDLFIETSRSAHSALIEIIDRDTAVEDASDYGSLKIGVHCINLGLLALSKNSIYAWMYYGDDAPSRIKDYNLHIFEACENAIFIRWLNSNGDYSYWAFSPYPFRDKSGDKLGSVINSFSEMALANSRNLPIGYRDAFDKISVIASAVPLLFRRKMLEIFTSPAVYLWNGLPSENLITTWTNRTYTTFVVDGLVLTEVTKTVGAGFDNGISSLITVSHSEIILIMLDLNLNSGVAPSVRIVDADVLVVISNAVVLSEGFNFISLTVARNDSEYTGYIQLFSLDGEVTDFSISEAIVKRKEKESDWIQLSGIEGSHSLMLKKDNDNFECTLVLPENFTQQLSGQNI